MSAIITEKFRKHNATQFYESFSESSASVYYLFIGKATAFTSATTTGSDNTALGYAAGYTQTTSGANVYIGKSAGYSFTGTDSTFLGQRCAENATTGTNNVCIGKESSLSANDASNEFVLGNGNTNNLRCNDTSISSLSDRRDKTDIIDLTAGLDFLNTLQPRQFKWQTRDGNIKDGKIRAGFIAQELQEAQKDFDFLDLVMDNNPDKLEAKQEHLIPVLVNAIKELSAEVEQLKSQLNN